MATYTLSLTVSDFDIYDDNVPLFVPLTERQQAVLLAFSAVVQNRALWNGITDAEWDEWQAWLGALYGEIT